MTRRSIQLIREGDRLAEVEVLLDADDHAWGPTIGIEEIRKLDRVRRALRAGDVLAASREAKVYRLYPEELGLVSNPPGFGEVGQRALSSPQHSGGRLDSPVGNVLEKEDHVMSTSGTIRTGIGGWTFDPWEGTFYPEKLPKKRQLEFASRELAAIEINGTYYGSQKPETFAKWASEVPDGFIFSLKASRFTTNRKVLAEGGESVEKFLTQGLTELGDRLGPILWQFAPTKKFEPEDFEGFLKLLPEKLDGLKLQHALEVRNDTFLVPEFAALARKYRAAIVYAQHEDYPEIADVTADFVYARLQKGSDDIKTCYPPKALDEWAVRLKEWAGGGEPADLPKIDPDTKPARKARDVFAFFITSGKVNAPNGARELQKRAG